MYLSNNYDIYGIKLLVVVNVNEQALYLKIIHK